MILHSFSSCHTLHFVYKNSDSVISRRYLTGRDEHSSLDAMVETVSLLALCMKPRMLRVELDQETSSAVRVMSPHSYVGRYFLSEKESRSSDLSRRILREDSSHALLNCFRKSWNYACKQISLSSSAFLEYASLVSSFLLRDSGNELGEIVSCYLFQFSGAATPLIGA